MVRILSNCSLYLIEKRDFSLQKDIKDRWHISISPNISANRSSSQTPKYLLWTELTSPTSIDYYCLMLLGLLVWTPYSMQHWFSFTRTDRRFCMVSKDTSQHLRTAGFRRSKGYCGHQRSSVDVCISWSVSKHVLSWGGKVGWTSKSAWDGTSSRRYLHHHLIGIEIDFCKVC